jgi:hypothetical protein
MEDIIIKDIIVKELDFDQVVVFFVTENEPQFQSLSHIILERDFLYDQFVDDNNLVIFDLKFDNKILRFESGVRIEENKMYMRLFSHYPDFITAGWVIKGYYHSGDKYRQLSRPQNK